MASWDTVDATFKQQLLHVAVAQGEAIVEPDPVTDDFAGKAVVLVTLGVCGWGHAWLPILEVDWSSRGHHQVIMSWVRKQEQQVDKTFSTQPVACDKAYVHRRKRP